MRLAALAPLALAAGCAAAPGEVPVAKAASPWALRNAGFEAAAGAGARCAPEWSCTMHSNPNSFRFTLETASPAEGRQSLCIERVAPEPWAVASQSVPAAAMRGRKVRFSITLRGERLAGPGAGPWLMVNGISDMLLHEERVAVLGPQWERHSIEVLVPPQAHSLEVGATLQGAGRACIDDARLDPA